MLEQCDDTIVGWLAELADPLPCSLTVPPGTSTDAGVGCYLLALVPVAPPRGARLPPVEAIARHLVTTWGPEPRAAHRLLGEILVAASARSDVQVEHDEPPIAVWQSLGLPAGPGLVLRSLVRWPVAEPDVPLVRVPLVAHVRPEVPERFDPAVGRTPSPPDAVSSKE